jgi:peptidyl-prolyl cis-trans isomerase A (cyclophilin A)/peptidyl-prolyl cis-trans isomerase B (cyclophilin B)
MSRMKQLLLVLGVLVLTGIQSSIAADAPAGATQLAAAPPAAAGSAEKPAGGVKENTAAPARTPAGPVRVQVVTSSGSFTIELLAERAPLTVAQFLKYVDQGFYSGTIFHRVIPNFVIQGGGFDTNYKLKGAPTRVVNESGNGLTNQRGTVGLARPPEPHGGDCQFYVNLFDNAALDPNQTRWGYAVFGKIVEGMDVVDRIGNVATGSKGPFKEDAPLQQVVIERIERVATP